MATKHFRPTPGHSLDTTDSKVTIRRNALVPSRNARREAVIPAHPAPIKPLVPSKVIKGARP